MNDNTNENASSRNTLNEKWQRDDFKNTDISIK